MLARLVPEAKISHMPVLCECEMSTALLLLYRTLLLFALLIHLRGSPGKSDNWEAVGCFRDDSVHSTLPDNFFNPTLHFNDLWPELKPLVEECSGVAEKKGYTVFGIQFHQECWGGQNGSLTYDKYGQAHNCRVGVDGYGVGQVFANFVYERKAVDGGWSSWSNWTTCHVTCGGGEQRRMRTCTNPAPEYGGKSCAGVGAQTTKCNTRPCPVDGVWSEWTSWPTCHVTCGGGIQERTRNCRKPLHGGKACSGSTRETKGCNTQHCPVDGVWSEWTSWPTCHVTCGGGIQERTRNCRKPLHGGKACSGSTRETKGCNTQHCPVHGAWSRWSVLGQCSKSCGNGFHRRSRTCTNPRPSHRGRGCSGKDRITIKCRVRTCSAVRRFLLCERHRGAIQCPRHQRINIKYANYGRTAGRQVCGLGYWFPTNCRAQSSQRIVNSRCRGRWFCNLQANNWHFGDPCYHVYKYLEVLYTCE